VALQTNSSVNLRQKLFAHLETMRPYTLFWCGLVSLVGASLTSGDLPPVRTALLVFFIPIMGWIAGLYLADYYDRTLDAIQKPQRPLPSGRIIPTEALVVGALFAIAGLLLTLFLPWLTIILVITVSVLVFCYAKFTKTRGLLGNFNRGALTVVTYLFGVFSVGMPISSIPMSLWVLSLVFFFHDTNSNIIGAIRDVHGDTTGGYKTTPVLYGIKKALIISVFLSVLYLLLTVGIISVTQVLQFPWYFLGLFSLGVLVLCVMYSLLFHSLEALTRKQALRAHELFVTERIVFASAFIVGVAQSHMIALLLFLVSLVVTLLSQHLLRERYELT
jgi:4-hydroxybenzoate polyprenyltransferase/geranylgeranylglycerol-phosphate geranylgeranyltransferase